MTDPTPKCRVTATLDSGEAIVLASGVSQTVAERTAETARIEGCARCSPPVQQHYPAHRIAVITVEPQP